MARYVLLHLSKSQDHSYQSNNSNQFMVRPTGGWHYTVPHQREEAYDN